MFWSATTDPTVLQATATQPAIRTKDQFDLFDLKASATLLVLPDHEELLLGHGNRTVRMSVRGASLLAGPVTLEFHIASATAFLSRSAALQRFAAFRLSRSGTIAAAKMGSATKRLLLLRTLDALAAAGSYRDIATTLFGAELVDTHWNAASDHLRSRVRRLIRQARTVSSQGSASLFPSE